MNEIRLTLESVSPMFLYGAYSDEPELRAAPFRGQLRYWFRTVHPGLSRQKLSKAESALFGSTQVGSRVSLSIAAQAENSVQIGSRYYLPHKIHSDTEGYLRRRYSNPAILENSIFNLRVGFQNEYVVEDFLKSFLLWLNLGGVGKRSRRGFGSLRVISVGDADIPEAYAELLGMELEDDANGLLTHIHAVLNTALPPNSIMTLSTSEPFPKDGGLENYPSFAPDSWAVLVCEHGFASYEDAMKQFWLDHLRSEGIRDDRAFGYAKHGRRASPFHLHIGRTKSGYHLILTAFNAKPSPKHDFWERHKSLFRSCQDAYGGRLFTNAEKETEDAA